jgi:WD repeat and SOF domain-containing protein 1
MVKVKAICRNEKDYVKHTNTQIEKVYRNPAEAALLHPFQKAREYKRALNAAKLEKVFAKPFVCALDSHSDGINVLAKNKFDLREILSASADGEIIYWNMGERKPLF